MQLFAFKEGSETFVSARVNRNMLDLTLASPVSRFRVYWCIEADAWGRDHVPIRPVPISGRPSMPGRVVWPTGMPTAGALKTFAGLGNSKVYLVAWLMPWSQQRPQYRCTQNISSRSSISQFACNREDNPELHSVLVPEMTG